MSVDLGYYQLADADCTGNWWTHDRYHPDAAYSLLKVIEQLAENRPVKAVPVNVNLDHQAWTEYHHYSPLTGTLNPIHDSAHNLGMLDLHRYGKERQNTKS